MGMSLDKISPGIKKSALLFLPLFLTGCFSFVADRHHHSRSHGVPLSEAMKSSAAGSQTPLPGGGGSHDSFHADHAAGRGYSAVSAGGGTALAHGNDDVTGEDFLFTLSTEQIVPFENYIRGITRVALNLGGRDDYNYFGFSFGLGAVTFRDGSLPDLAVTEAWMADLGLTYRRYFAEPHVFLNPYATAGLYCQGMHWRYRTAVNLGGDIIKSDGIGGGGGFLGAGLTIKGGDVLDLFGEVRVGQSWFDAETSEGFANNVLDDFGYYSFTVGLSLKF